MATEDVGTFTITLVAVRHANRLALMRVSVSKNDCGGEVPRRGMLIMLHGEHAPTAVRELLWRVKRVTSDRYVYGFYDLWLEPHGFSDDRLLKSRATSRKS